MLRVTSASLSLALTALSVLAGCAGSSEPGEATGALCDPGLSYQVDVAPLMERYCVRCHAESVPLRERHGAPGDHNFDSEQGVLAQAQHISLSAGIGPDAENRSMPPHGQTQPSDDERRTLAHFLACQLESTTRAAHVHQH